MSENLSDVLKSDITLIPADISHIAGISQDTLENTKVYVHVHPPPTIHVVIDKIYDVCHMHTWGHGDARWVCQGCGTIQFVLPVLTMLWHVVVG